MDISDEKVKQLINLCWASGEPSLAEYLEEVLEDRRGAREIERARIYDDMDWLMGTGKFSQ